MSISFSMGYYSADNRTISKGYSVAYSGVVNLISPENNVENIVIEIATLDHISNPENNIITIISDVNYMYVGAPFNRYYYIVDRKITTGGRFILTGAVDVLMSFGGDIRALNALLIRTEEGSDYTPDGAFPLYPYKNIKVAELEGGDFNITTATGLNYNYVLNVAGGGAE